MEIDNLNYYSILTIYHIGDARESPKFDIRGIFLISLGVVSRVY